MDALPSRSPSLMPPAILPAPQRGQGRPTLFSTSPGSHKFVLAVLPLVLLVRIPRPPRQESPRGTTALFCSTPPPPNTPMIHVASSSFMAHISFSSKIPISSGTPATHSHGSVIVMSKQQTALQMANKRHPGMFSGTINEPSTAAYGIQSVGGAAGLFASFGGTYTVGMFAAHCAMATIKPDKQADGHKPTFYTGYQTPPRPHHPLITPSDHRPLPRK